ncbi:urease accessory protein UreE [Natronococcus jeotgali]|uniref:Urease accessory protein UreE n=1 Tax=Natronococcus jeotgali DSM 18795 TaxID=1227498 RepID=L9WUI8_9EURY|nr:urease accessory protein UreE [Natronococcus jeotgali]ELY53125.1 urease accessory protein UreE [Natronococcus jeotgali DSM 18795]
MERIDGVVGNVHADDELAALRDEHRENGTLERVVIDAADRRRSRFRATTDAGTDVGVVLDRPAVSVGDVLLVEDERMVLVAFEPREALAVELPEATPATLEAAVELGHRVGNQHWDLTVEDGVVYVPLAADRHIVERVVDDVVPGAEIEATTVEADLFVPDRRDGEAGHGHDDHDHAHPHGGHDHDHHSHGHDHDHGN